MSASPVVVTKLTREFQDTTAVEDVSFEVKPGRVTGLLGRNGAGKTTTLRMILGLATPTRGTATVFGHDYQRLSGAAYRIGVSMGDIAIRVRAEPCQELTHRPRIISTTLEHDHRPNLLRLSGDP